MNNINLWGMIAIITSTILATVGLCTISALLGNYRTAMNKITSSWVTRGNGKVTAQLLLAMSAKKHIKFLKILRIALYVVLFINLICICNVCKMNYLANKAHNKPKREVASGLFILPYLVPNPHDSQATIEIKDIDKVAAANIPMPKAKEAKEPKKKKVHKKKKSTQVRVNHNSVQWADDYILTPAERALLCRTTFCEAGNQSEECQYAIALTILNRVQSDVFPNDIRSVVYARGQFAVTNWSDFESRTWTDRTERAVTRALQSNNYDRRMLYFRSGHYHGFGIPYMNLGAMYFNLRRN